MKLLIKWNYYSKKSEFTVILRRNSNLEERNDIEEWQSHRRTVHKIITHQWRILKWEIIGREKVDIIIQRNRKSKIRIENRKYKIESQFGLLQNGIFQ